MPHLSLLVLSSPHLTTQQVLASSPQLTTPQTQQVSSFNSILTLQMMVPASPRPANYTTGTTSAFLRVTSLVAGARIAAPSKPHQQAQLLPSPTSSPPPPRMLPLPCWCSLRRAQLTTNRRKPVPSSRFHLPSPQTLQFSMLVCAFLGPVNNATGTISAFLLVLAPQPQNRPSLCPALYHISCC